MLDNQLQPQQQQDQTRGFDEVDPFNWQIPECCRESWDSCKHVVGKREKKRVNRGL